jgi:hypothetical protein
MPYCSFDFYIFEDKGKLFVMYLLAIVAILWFYVLF